MKESLNFIYSSNSFNNYKLPQKNVEYILEIIDYVLIKIYADFKLEGKLRTFFTNNIIYCKNLEEELEKYLLEFKDRNLSILARFYEIVGRIKDSLECWRKIGKNTSDTKLSDEACEETTRILKTCKEKRVIFEYLKWILVKNHQIGSKVFYSISEDVVSPGYFY